VQSDVIAVTLVYEIDCIVSGFDLTWFSSLSSEHLCVFGLHGAMYIKTFFAYILLFTF